jgi:hypothetical protein
METPEPEVKRTHFDQEDSWRPNGCIRNYDCTLWVWKHIVLISALKMKHFQICQDT